MKDLDVLAKEVFEANKAKGFHDTKHETGVYLALIVSELSEALESHRQVCMTIEPMISVVLGFTDVNTFKLEFEENIKDTFEDELADAYIRILDYCGMKEISLKNAVYNASCMHKHKEVGSWLNEVTKRVTQGVYMDESIYYIKWIADKMQIDLESHIKAKLRYNKTRPIRHGKAY